MPCHAEPGSGQCKSEQEPGRAFFVNFLEQLVQFTPIQLSTRHTSRTPLMNGAVPLLRIVDTATRSSWSRIPHLKAHIHSRQLHAPAASLKRSCRPKLPRGSASRGTRQSSASAIDGSLFGQFDGAQEEDRSFRRPTEGAAQHVDKDSAHRTQILDSTSSNKTARPVRSVSTSELVAEGHPDRVLFALVSTADGARFIHTASDEAFARAVICLDPNHFIEHYKWVYRNLPPALHVGARFRVIRSFEDRCLIFRSCIEWVLQQRRNAGFSLTLPVYRHVLQCAEAMGDDQLAKAVFDVDMPTNGVLPDLECYNSLITACARSFEHDSAQRRHTRRTAYHDFRRRTPKQTTAEAIIRRSRPARTRSDEIRDYALNAFKELSERDFQPDEHTFTGLMFALGQLGDLDGVNSVLRSVWNINVDMLMTYDEEEIEGPTFYAEDHPLRPSQRLLEAIVHIYGQNNQIYAASLLSDYVSRNYNIPISQRVWEQQFDLTYQFAFRGRNYHNRREMCPGNVSHESLKRVYDVMTDEPHNVKPTVAMVAMLATNDARWVKFKSAIEHLREAKRLLDVERTKLSEMYDAMLPLVLDSEAQPPFSAEFLTQRRAFITQSIQTDVGLQMVILAVRRVFNAKSTGIKPYWRWQHVTQRIPDIVRDFLSEIPNKFTYDALTGTVALENGYVHRTHAIELADDFLAQRVGLLRHTLDLDHHPILAERLKALPEDLHPSSYLDCYLCGQPGHTGQQCPDKDLALSGPLKEAESEGPSDEESDEPLSIWQHHKVKTKKLEHVTTASERDHQKSLEARWKNAHDTGYYDGTTPDPTKARDVHEEGQHGEY